MEKYEIMKVANALVAFLNSCDDEEFVNDVICRVSSADWFDDEEIEEARKEG